jgi:flagellar hook-basal body complex protein FliE
MSNLPVDGIGGKGLPGGTGSAGAPSAPEKGKFDAIIEEALSKVNEVQENVEKAVTELAEGGDITNAVLAIEKADMSFQLMVEIRNKLIRTYEEVMRMQV